MENNHFDLNAKRRMLYKRKKIRRLLKLFLTSFFSLMIVLGIASSYIKNNTNITTLNKNALKNKISSTQENKDNFKVCIDPGHGDEDIGAKGINGSYEKDLVLNIALELGKILKEKDIDIEITDAAKEVMVKEGYDPVYGARPLKRYIGNTLETMIARRLIAGEIYNGCTIVVDGEDDNISIKVK